MALYHLENELYQQALYDYSVVDFASADFDPPVRKNIETVAVDEAQHVDFLTMALTATNVTPAPDYTYTFPSTDVKAFLGLS